MKKELIKAYLAGLIDGEGTVTLIREHSLNKFKYPVVSMSSTSIELINIFIEYYGGTVSKQKKYEEHHKQSYSWRLQSNRALALLSDILPYMLEPAKIYRGNILLGLLICDTDCLLFFCCTETNLL